MKRLVIGRGNDCDIIIQDSTDTVSRHHLVISIGITGKMTVSDTSANGTTVNGQHLTKGVTLPVKRGDEIRLGDTATLDWDRITDPYSSLRKITLGVTILILCLAIGGGTWWYIINRNNEPVAIEIPVNTAASDNSADWNKDSTLQVAPVATSIDIDGEANKNSVTNKESAKKITPSNSNRKKSQSPKVNKVSAKGINKSPSSDNARKQPVEKHNSTPALKNENSGKMEIRTNEYSGEKD